MASLLDEEERKKKTGKALSRMSQMKDLKGVQKTEQQARMNDSAQKAAIITENKEDIKKSLVKMDLKPKEKKAIKEHLDSPESVKDSTDKAAGVKEQSKSPSTADKFKEALTFFAPQLLGAAIGGAIEGEAGAIAGFEKGGQLRDDLTDYRVGQEELQLKQEAALAKQKALEAGPKKKTFQQARDSSYRMDDGTMVPLIFDPNTGESLHPVTRKPLTPKEMSNIVGGEQRRLGQLGHTITKDSQFSNNQQEVQSGFDASRSAMDAVDSLFDIRDADTGVITGRYNDLAAMAGADNPKYVALRTETGAAIASFLKTTSGATVSEQERQFLRQIIPTTMDNPKEFQAKLTQFRQIIVRQQRKELMSIMQTQPLKRDTAAEKLRMLNEEEGSLPKEVQTKVGPKAGSAFERISQMDDEKRKRYEAFKAKRRGK